MIDKIYKGLFRPDPEMTNAQVRKLGIFVSLISMGVIAALFVILFSKVLPNKQGSVSMYPMFIFLIGIFLGLGLHRLIWGNISREPLHHGFLKGLVSLCVTIGLLMSFSFIGGMIMALILRSVK
jgi:hypothetical protein